MQPFKNKTIVLSSEAIQKQATGQMQLCKLFIWKDIFNSPLTFCFCFCMLVDEATKKKKNPPYIINIKEKLFFFFTFGSLGNESTTFIKS